MMISETAERADIEMALIRILSVHGVILSSENMSTADRQERIRVAIMQRRIQHGMFSDDLTYAEAYKRCFGRPVELRKVPRPEMPGTVPEGIAEPDARPEAGSEAADSEEDSDTDADGESDTDE